MLPSPATHMLSDAYGQWRRLCLFRPVSHLRERALDLALDTAYLNYGGGAR